MNIQLGQTGRREQSINEHKKKSYKDLVKYSSEVWIFFSTVFAFSSSWPHSQPTPSWEGRLRSFTPLQVFLWPSFCFPPNHPLLLMPDQVLRATLKGEVRSEGDLFTSEKAGCGTDTSQIFILFWCSHTVLVLLFASGHLLPLWDPARAARG